MTKTLSFLLLTALSLSTQARETATDGDWTLQQVALSDTPEAERMIRVGDIDNLGFGFPEVYDPFSGRPTEPHPFPFEPSPEDASPTDRIMVGSSFKGEATEVGQDGYSFEYHPQDRPLKAEPLRLPLGSLEGVTVRDAVLCLFVDDFQAPRWKGSYQASFNGVRFPEMERVLNALDQTGPIGKVIYIRLTQEMLDQLKGPQLEILIDDPESKAGDGFALDFAKLMVNVKSFPHTGTVPGRVVDTETLQPIPGAAVSLPGLADAKADSEGLFRLEKVPAGLAVIKGEASGYVAAYVPVDVISGETSEPVEIPLTKSAVVTFTGRELREGERLRLEKIQFDVSSAELRAEGKAELDRVAAFLKTNDAAEIELSGHTSSEGGAVLNRELSFRRVLSCKAYLVAAGIDAARITTVGHGPDQPVAGNDTEQGRAQNRRVEMKLTRL